MSESVTERQANLETVRAFFDPDRTESRTNLFTDDGSKENVYGPPSHIPQRLWRGRAELERNRAEQPRRFEGAVWRDLRIYSGWDPAIVWVTGRFDDSCLMDGYPYPQDYVHFFDLQRGLIREWREYFNPYLFVRSAAREELPPRFIATPLAARDLTKPVGSAAQALASAALVKQFLDEPECRDALWAEDAILEAPWRSPGYPAEQVRGRKALLSYTQMWTKRVHNFHHREVVVCPAVDPNLVWATSRTDDATRLGGVPYRQRYVFAFRLRAGKVALVRMYFDTLAYVVVS